MVRPTMVNVFYKTYVHIKSSDRNETISASYKRMFSKEKLTDGSSRACDSLTHSNVTKVGKQLVVRLPPPNPSAPIEIPYMEIRNRAKIVLPNELAYRKQFQKDRDATEKSEIRRQVPHEN